jgi:hypothetical protein
MFFQNMIEFHIFQTYKSFLSTLSDQQRDGQNSQKSSSTATTSKRAFIDEILKSSTSRQNRFRDAREKSIDSLSRKSSLLRCRQRIISDTIIEQSLRSFTIIESTRSTRETSTEKAIFSQSLKADRSRIENNFEMTAFFNEAQMTALQAMMQEIFQSNNSRRDDNERNSDDNDDNSDSTDDESDSDFNSQ